MTKTEIETLVEKRIADVGLVVRHRQGMIWVLSQREPRTIAEAQSQLCGALSLSDIPAEYPDDIISNTVDCRLSTVAAVLARHAA